MRKLRQGGLGDILRSQGQPESGEPGLPCCDRSVHALPSGKGVGRERRGMSQGPEVCLLGEDIPSLPVTSLLVRVRVAWKRNAFSFLSGTLTFPSILLVETDAQEVVTGVSRGFPGRPGHTGGCPSGPGTVGGGALRRALGGSGCWQQDQASVQFPRSPPGRRPG